MRKLLTITLIMLALSSFAQHKAFQMGFKGALNLGWFATDATGYKGEGANFGGSWGFTADIFLMENYSFTTGFDLIYLNSTISYPDHKPHDVLTVMVDGVSTRKYKPKYVEIPLVLTMKTNKIGNLRYYGQVGFGMGFLISAKADEDFVANDSEFTSSETVNAFKDLSRTRQSLIIGLGAEIPIQGSTYIRTGVKFDNAFVNILKGYNNTDAYLKNNGRNSFIEINLSVFF
ncbi:MAG: hypothetical protein C0595_05265 [Marinilabiliales bacterium]|nr:MAG: hypothetical protein C0595_05265 [Marinilabiliales bacterium]